MPVRRQLSNWRLLSLAFLTACASTTPEPPVPPKSAEIFQSELQPALVDYLRQENDFALRELGSQQRLIQELTSEILDDSPLFHDSPPLRFGEYYFFSRQEPGLRHPGIYRTRGGDSAAEIFFDPNSLFHSHPQAALGVLRIAPSGTKIAFTVDLDHRGIYTLLVWDFETQSITEASANDVASLEWGASDVDLYFVTRQRGAAASVDAYSTIDRTSKHVLSDLDPACTVQLNRNKDGRSLFVSIEKPGTTSLFEVEFMRARHLARHVRSGPESRTSATHADCILFVSDHRDLVCESRATGKSTSLVSLSQDSRIEDFDVFEDGVALFERRGGLPALQILTLPYKKLIEVTLPRNTERIWKLHAPDFQGGVFRFGFESLIFPSGSAEGNIRTGAIHVTVAPQFPPGVRADEYALEHANAVSDDGTRVPISIARLASKIGRPLPTLLVGYGAYGATGLTSYSRAYDRLLQRGFAVAVAHVRGDGYLGEEWHRAGSAMNKRRSFEDFIASARFLIANGYSQPRTLFAYGKSAGGLLVSVSAARAPGLFRAIVLDRPFVDVLAGLTSADAKLRERERIEWGNPEVPGEREFIRSYSPVEQVAAYRYPDVLAFTSFRDDVVPFWDVARWFALLREVDSRAASTATKKLLLVSHTATHEEEVDTAAQALLEARIDAFLLSKTGN